MPQDPRHGEFGHRRTSDEDSGVSGSGRRRRALSEDGSGGTRVIDLLAKNGKAPGQATQTSGHRRAAAESSQAPAPQATQPPQVEQSGRRTRAPQAPPPSEQPQPWTTPGSGPHRTAQPSGRNPRPTPPPASANTPPPGWTPPANGTGPRPVQPPAAPAPAAPPRPVSPHSGRNPQPFAPAAFNGEPPRRPEPPQTNGADPEATQISQALTTDKPRRNPRPPAGAPAPARPSSADDELEATTQHAPVRPQQAKPKPAAEPAAAARPAPESPAEATAVVAPANAPADDDYAELDAFDDDDDYGDEYGGEEGEREERNNDVQQIDATLARFSAVHDEIAAEEAKRRNKLFGKRKEPELGTDMPFDFHDAQDRSGKSRMEWKKNQRKRRTNLIVISVAVVASLTVFLSLGLIWG